MSRFLMMIRHGEDPQNPDNRPDLSPELIENMGKLIDEMTKAGVLLDTAGLKPTHEGVRLHWKSGDLSYTDGPFTEAKEIVGGYAMLQCADRPEAVEWARRFVSLHEDLDITVELREIEEG
ncbi:YCII-related domain protein [Streptomyces sp. YIM 130001]|uniref:YciI family protein n=1 Tax=Streptomyces sp. YIM 130001 TaxID=2259644 RepID=UPI000E64A998|nr:YciI family protein [Streptomyces sp. YIM 130001]RII21006.1 YCII-related domain protein [Streptomyces sp. YIM 130001]